ncbi:MAG: hypothetical protein IJV40_10550 [Oscillospiraceae bacterium]|nr:hypothetical protein [Oscillospiraceae bacterium]
MSLQAGVGRSEVVMTPDMLPYSGEGYASIHDCPSVKVLLLKTETENFALVNIGLVMGDRNVFLDAAQELLGINRDHIVVHFQHILSTPHYEIAESPTLHSAYMDAFRSAVLQAEATLGPARLGVGTAKTNVTVNRVAETRDGWWQGVNQDGPTDPNVYFLRVDRADSSLMGLVYTLNAAPGCLEFSTLPEGKAVSADIAGVSERFLESQLSEDIVAMYCTGATGDQWTALRARLDYRTPDGEQVFIDLGEAGFALTTILGIRLGEQVMRAALETKTCEIDAIGVKKATFFYPHQQVLDASPARAAKSCRYEIAGEDEAGVTLLTLGDAAILFCGVELNVSTMAALRAASPYGKTWVVEFSELGGGYLPEAEYYDKVSYQALRSHYARGSAEQLIRDMVSLLEEQHG